MMILTPKNWGKFQHYKDRCPPWIKLHRDILNDRHFMSLPTSSKALAPLCWLLASESKTGSFDANIDELEFRLRMNRKEIQDGLNALIKQGFFVVADGVLAECLQDAIPETETEGEAETKPKAEAKTSTSPAGDDAFAKFWAAYPKKKSKGDAEKVWSKIKGVNGLLEQMLSSIEALKRTPDWTKEGGQFIPYPATWLRDKGWEDEVTSAKPNGASGMTFQQRAAMLGMATA